MDKQGKWSIDSADSASCVKFLRFYYLALSESGNAFADLYAEDGTRTENLCLNRNNDNVVNESHKVVKTVTGGNTGGNTVALATGKQQISEMVQSSPLKGWKYIPYNIDCQGLPASESTPMIQMYNVLVFGHVWNGDETGNTLAFPYSQLITLQHSDSAKKMLIVRDLIRLLNAYPHLLPAEFEVAAEEKNEDMPTSFGVLANWLPREALCTPTPSNTDSKKSCWHKFSEDIRKMGIKGFVIAGEHSRIRRGATLYFGSEKMARSFVDSYGKDGAENWKKLLIDIYKVPSRVVMDTTMSLQYKDFRENVKE